MFNPVIIIAIIVQAIVAKFSRIMGAVLGYAVTTGILLWGLSLYGSGDRIALFGMPLSLPIFVLACLVWYAFDTVEFIQARKQNAASALPIVTSPTLPEKQDVPNGDNNVTLSVNWKGMFMAVDYEIQIWLDGALAGSGSFNKGFDLQIHTTAGSHTISLNQKGANPNVTLNAEANKSYRVDLDFNRVSAKYKLTCVEVSNLS